MALDFDVRGGHSIISYTKEDLQRMGKPIARVGDQHTCPMTTGTVPHVGGPIAGPGATTVLANNMPVALIGDAATCSGPPDVLVGGSPLVLAENRPVAYFGANTAHGGVIVGGSSNVRVGAPNPPQVARLA
jgi:uncharacterized Zn-binding protein involved in type VI secretion